MPWPILDILLALPVFALIMMRLSGLVMTAPLFSSQMIPIKMRVGLIVVLSAMLFPLVSQFAPSEVTLATVVTGAMAELMIGAGIGLSMSIFMMGTEVAGRMIAQQAGLGMSQIVDPTQNIQTSIIGQIYSISLTVLFLMIGGHRALLAALMDTYQVIPMLSFQADNTIALLMIEMLTSSFIFGIRVAAPVVLALFLTGTALGVLSRTMPQLNILTVGFTLRALIALGVAGIALAASRDMFLRAIWNAFELVRGAFGLDPTGTRLVI